jgi:hypothetical protein
MMSRSVFKRLIVQVGSMPKFGVGQVVYYNNGRTRKITDLRYKKQNFQWQYQLAEGYWYYEDELKLV